MNKNKIIGHENVKPVDVDNIELEKYYYAASRFASKMDIKLVVPQSLSEEDRASIGVDQKKQASLRRRCLEEPVLCHIEEFANRIASENAEKYFSALVVRRILDENGQKGIPTYCDKREEQLAKVYYLAHSLGFVGEIVDHCPQSIDNSVISRLGYTFERVITARSNHRDGFNSPREIPDQISQTRNIYKVIRGLALTKTSTFLNQARRNERRK